MRPLRQRSDDARNTLFDAALEFGADWRRDVRSLAEERLPGLDEGQRSALAAEVEDARRSIEEWIARRWNERRGEWSTADARAARRFIRTTYPWLDRRNVAHAVSQGTYYAWHG